VFDEILRLNLPAQDVAYIPTRYSLESKTWSLLPAYQKQTVNARWTLSRGMFRAAALLCEISGRPYPDRSWDSAKQAHITAHGWARSQSLSRSGLSPITKDALETWSCKSRAQTHIAVDVVRGIAPSCPPIGSSGVTAVGRKKESHIPSRSKLFLSSVLSRSLQDDATAGLRGLGCLTIPSNCCTFVGRRTMYSCP